ncbi:TetR/AcrR family transcriptional regulator [Gorillibacterium sp. CAU 1737]|uniref:TetR/AcrR family transcriptional regulator n=1 Tax=Gorillibacterium sp. CAU 1737 TaxID=3140362 RepID=UPI0032615701
MSNYQEKWLEDLLQLTEDTGKKTEKQIRILEAATEIFSQKGYEATSTSEIAQKAGVAEGTIFRHYKTKRDLLLSIAGPILVKLAAPFLLRDFVKLMELPYEKADDFFRALAKDRFKFARENTKIIKILIHEVPFQPELMGQIKRLSSDIVFNRIEKVVEHFQEAGQLVSAPPWRIMRTGASLVIGMILTHLFIAPDFPIDEDEEIDLAIDLLMNGIGNRSM